MSSKLSKKASCIRKTANFSRVKSNLLIDSKTFAPEILEKMIPYAAPKIDAIVKKIREVDEHDLKHEGKLFKHIIYTDVPQANYSIKIIASALSVMGYNFAGIPLKDEEKLLETRDQNYAVLLTKPFGKITVKTKTKKAILDAFNDRKKNVHGKIIRILCLSDAFKEGIDTFDVKYVHMFENTITRADQKQAIGRATRFCGQKGLEFKPRVGWPLHVFRYNVRIPKDKQKDFGTSTETLHGMFLEKNNLDLKRLNFAEDLEEATADASVDKALTEVLHAKSMELAMKGGANTASKKKKVRFAQGIKSPNGDVLKSPSIHDMAMVLYDKKKKKTEKKGKKSKESENAIILSEAKKDTPKRIMDAKNMQAFVKKKYADLIYKTEELVNKCVDKDGNVSTARLIEFTPSQEFVRRYFRPESAYKGILLNHSVGTGKTCSAIAATGSFEREGYTILWVTRHSLKTDVYKNIFDQVCHEGFRDRLGKDPKSIPRPSSSVSGSKLAKQFLSSNWIGPISYKQFSNMLLKNNKYYEEMVKRNGEKDPMRKTLVIIDEAHKIYSPQTVGAEKPNAKILESMIQNSFNVSGDKSVRLLLMTATPFTSDPIEQMWLLNLMRPKADALPNDFSKISKKWLDNEGRFTKEGRREYMDAVSGYISYLDRSADARYFAQAHVNDVLVDMTTMNDENPPKHHDVKIKELANDIKEMNQLMREERESMKGRVAEIKKQYQEEIKMSLAGCKDGVTTRYTSEMDSAKGRKEQGNAKCSALGRGNVMPCKKTVSDVYKSEVDGIRKTKSDGMERCKEGKMSDTGKRDKQIEEAESRLSNIKDEIVEIRLAKMREADILKKFNARNKELVGLVKQERLEAKVFKVPLKKMRDKLKSIPVKDRKSKAAVELRKEIKILKTQLDKVRNNITNIKNKQKVLKLEVGRAVIGKDMSQEENIHRCLKLKEKY
jgi:superfamily II DNA or RNA helicase